MNAKKANAVLLRKKNKVLVVKSSHFLDAPTLATILKNLEPIGYVLSKDVIEVLQTYSIDEITSFYKDIAKTLKEMVGAHKKWEPMYPNFPTQVMEASDCELYLNALMHYFGDWVGLRIMPEYEKEERLPLIDFAKMKVINLGSEDEVVTIFKEMMASKTSISETDKEDLKWYLKTFNEDIPAITYKEILSFVYAELLSLKKVSAEDASKNFKTSTDILRLAVALSEGDVSLAGQTKFRNFKRSERRFLLGLLENCTTDITEDMLRHKNAWIRLGEKLHPFEYKQRMPKCFAAFDVIRNNKKYDKFGTALEASLEEGDVTKALKILKTRPGDFARRLDHLLRMSDDQDKVLRAFNGVAQEVSSNVLLQVMTHFQYRSEKRNLRVFMPKGNAAKIQAVKNTLKRLPQTTCTKVFNICNKSLKKKYGELPKLGKVYIDPTLKDYVVPFSQRSASKALRTVARGSKVAIPEGDTLRFFSWWKDCEGRVDIDLSALMYDEDWNQIEKVSYTNLRSATYNAYHSGDITSAPKGACEFIDLDIPSILRYGGRYVIMTVLSYTGQSFSTLDESFCGWMIRKKPNSGEVFDARTVQDKFDIDSDSKVNIPVIFDLKDRKMIYTDLALSHVPSYINVESNKEALALMGQSINDLRKTNLFDLFTLHAKSRGTIVKSRKNADIIFSLDEGVTPFDIETIAGEYI